MCILGYNVNDINLLNKFVWNKLLQKNPSYLVSPPQISYYGYNNFFGQKNLKATT